MIPNTPAGTERIGPRVGHQGVGLAYSGLRLDGPAPTDAILSAHTLAPRDDCGGHVNLNAVCDATQVRRPPPPGTRRGPPGGRPPGERPPPPPGGRPPPPEPDTVVAGLPPGGMR